jgi:hypothetical protein
MVTGVNHKSVFYDNKNGLSILIYKRLVSMRGTGKPHLLPNGIPGRDWDSQRLIK